MGTPFLVRVDPGDGLPLYRQIVEQVKAAMAKGLIGPGDRLPSHRDLARDLLVAPLTVSRAYEALEREGLIATVRGRGTLVAGEGARVAREAEASLRGKAASLARQARALGLTRREALEALRDVWDEGKEEA